MAFLQLALLSRSGARWMRGWPSPVGPSCRGGPVHCRTGLVHFGPPVEEGLCAAGWVWGLSGPLALLSRRACALQHWSAAGLHQLALLSRRACALQHWSAAGLLQLALSRRACALQGGSGAGLVRWPSCRGGTVHCWAGLAYLALLSRRACARQNWSAAGLLQLALLSRRACALLGGSGAGLAHWALLSRSGCAPQV